MRILISGICGFVGSTLARSLAKAGAGHQLSGFDNFIRPGSETNREELRRLGVRLFHADARSQSDVDGLPPADWVVDAAANPSVLAGIDGRSSTRQLVEHNLLGTVNLLEFCQRQKAGLILLSTSRVYGIEPLAKLPVQTIDGGFRPVPGALPAGLTESGIGEEFSTGAPVSLYGATKLASEALALEYGEAFGLPVFVNRCGVLAGAGQFGRPDQGIFAFWINSHLRRRPLAYIGFGGEGHQVRDCLHPRDLVPLLEKQIEAPKVPAGDRIVNVGGGIELGHLAASVERLVRLAIRAPSCRVQIRAVRPFDLPWIVASTLQRRAVCGIGDRNLGARYFRGDSGPCPRQPTLAGALRTVVKAS